MGTKGGQHDPAIGADSARERGGGAARCHRTDRLHYRPCPSWGAPASSSGSQHESTMTKSSATRPAAPHTAPKATAPSRPVTLCAGGALIALSSPRGTRGLDAGGNGREVVPWRRGLSHDS